MNNLQRYLGRARADNAVLGGEAAAKPPPRRLHDGIAVIYGLALHVAEIPKMGIEGVEVEKPARTSAREFRSRDDDVDERSDNLHVTEQMSPRQDVASMAWKSRYFRRRRRDIFIGWSPARGYGDDGR